jgi:3-hydroxybutyryl-CoA dehydrogenase
MSTRSRAVSLSDKSPRSLELSALASEAGYCVRDSLATEQIFCDPNLTRWSEKSAALKSMMPRIGGSHLILVHTITFTTAELAAVFPFPQRVVGFGFLGKLRESTVVELAPGPETHPDLLEEAADFFRSLGKETEIVTDSVGLVGPRILSCLVNEAFCALEEQICAETELELAMRLGTNYPKGLIEWGKSLGYGDIVLVLEALAGIYGDAYLPNPLLRRYSLDKNI